MATKKTSRRGLVKSAAKPVDRRAPGKAASARRATSAAATAKSAKVSKTGVSTTRARGALQREVEQFLYRQSDLLDSKQWQACIDLYTGDGVYWMPSAPEHTHWDGMPSIFIEDTDLMTVRMKRITHPNAWSQQAEWATSHVVSNVVIEKVGANGDIHVRSRFHMMELRRDDLRNFGGTYRHHLKRTKGGLRIKLQRVDLFNAQVPFEYVLQIWV